MKAVIQRVSRAHVSVDGNVVSAIQKGLVALIGIQADDTDDDADYIVRKILSLRLWPNKDSGKAWDQSVQDGDLDILCVSQFTLCGRLKGNKVDFSKAMAPLEAKKLYESMLESLKTRYKQEKVHDGVFGAMMEVSIENSGPVTIQLDSQNR